MAFLFKRRIRKRDYPDLDEYIKKHYIEDSVASGAAFMGAQAMPTQAMSAMMTSAKPSAMQTSVVKQPTPSGGFLGAALSAGRKESSKASRESAPMEDTFEDESAEMMICASMDESDECIDFEEEHESKLEERIKHLSDTFSQYLLFLIEDKNMKNADVYKRAIVDKKVFSKIKNDVNYHPQKQTALCLCIGAKLNLDESKDLLARAGYALSPCDKTDIIFSYFIENEIYDMIELDIQLEEHGLPCIIS